MELTAREMYKIVKRTMNSVTKQTEKKLRARIALRFSQGWTVEKIGARTVCRMFGYLYSIKDGALMVEFNGGVEIFRPIQRLEVAR